ncbi:hypothetical protein N9R64_06370 [Emcibacteraceae bacterium]|nr:hypothetical protein [Emcibacteraceae bacterium]
MRKLSILSMIVFLLSLMMGHSISFAQSKSLEMKWKLEGFDRPESLHLSSDHSEIYVSNVNGDSRAKDGNGYISRVSLTGEIIEKDWITGLNGPKGFTVKGNTLYIADIDELVMVDINSKKIIKRVAFQDAGFLNDVNIVGDKVFISDTGKDTLLVYTEENGVEVFLSGEDVKAPNGLLPQDGKLLVTRMRTGELLSIDIETKNIDVVGNGIISGDGIGILEDGSYIITSFTGEIYHIKSMTETDQLLDSKPEKISQNDAYYFGGHLYVANMGNASITAWKVN